MTREKVILFTKIFILVSFTIIVGVDIWLAANGFYGDTISEVTQAYSWRWATIPLAYGVLTGHLFWYIRGSVSWKWGRIICLWVVAAASITLDVVDLYDVIPILPAAIGVPLGRLGWPQSWPKGHPLFVWKG